MQFHFNLDEVLQIAVRIEQNGLAFYENAASILPAHKEWLLFLADQEKSHEAFYKLLHEKFAKKEAVTDSIMGDQSEMLEGYLHALASSVVFRLSEDPKDKFSGNVTADQIIDDAMEREKDAVLFFSGIKESVRDEETRREIDAVIREEMNHLAILQRKKMELTQR